MARRQVGLCSPCWGRALQSPQEPWTAQALARGAGKLQPPPSSPLPRVAEIWCRTEAEGASVQHPHSVQIRELPHRYPRGGSSGTAGVQPHSPTPNFSPPGPPARHFYCNFGQYPRDGFLLSLFQNNRKSKKPLPHPSERLRDKEWKGGLT